MCQKRQLFFIVLLVLIAGDYYAFGLSQYGRSYNGFDYRYGFNGKEKDDNNEWGSQTHYDYGFRIYNPAIGKFLSVDPLTSSYPWYTPYQFAGNKPIWAIDVDGLEESLTNDGVHSDAPPRDNTPTLLLDREKSMDELMEKTKEMARVNPLILFMEWISAEEAVGNAKGERKEELKAEANRALADGLLEGMGGIFASKLSPVISPLLRRVGDKVLRLGTYPKGVSEIPINQLNPLHNVPRKGVDPDNIPKIRESIRTNGYDVNSPASATRLPNGDLIVTGGHHRIEAMTQLGEQTIPTKIYSYKDTDPERLGYFLGIARTTGKYKGYLPQLTNTQKSAVNQRLSAWRAHNSDQVVNEFEFK